MDSFLSSPGFLSFVEAAKEEEQKMARVMTYTCWTEGVKTVTTVQFIDRDDAMRAIGRLAYASEWAACVPSSDKSGDLWTMYSNLRSTSSKEAIDAVVPRYLMMGIEENGCGFEVPGIWGARLVGDGDGTCTWGESCVWDLPSLTTFKLPEEDLLGSEKDDDVSEDEDDVLEEEDDVSEDEQRSWEEAGVMFGRRLCGDV